VAAELGLRLRPFVESDGVESDLFDVWERILDDTGD